MKKGENGLVLILLNDKHHLQCGVLLAQTCIFVLTKSEYLQLPCTYIYTCIHFIYLSLKGVYCKDWKPIKTGALTLFRDFLTDLKYKLV